MMYLQVPTKTVADFTFAKFADYVLDHSPAYATRSLLRLGMKARDAIAAAVDGIAEMPDDVGKLFKQAAEEAPVPRLVLKPPTEGEPIPIPASAYDSFYEAIEGMTTERPVLDASTPAPTPLQKKPRPKVA